MYACGVRPNICEILLMGSMQRKRVQSMRKNYLGFLSFVVFLLGLVACNNAADTPTDPVSEVGTAVAETVVTEIEVEPTEPDSEPAEPVSEESGALLVPQGEFREVYYAPVALTMSLDGDLADWEGVPMVKIPDPPSEVIGRDTALTFAAAADETYLYLMANVFDRTIVSGEHGEDYWNEDSVEFYINGTGDLTLTQYRDGVAQINVPPLNMGRSAEEMIFSGIQNETTGVQGIVVEVENGYVVELAVPLQNDVWSINAAHGEVIGFQAHLNGSGGGDRNEKIIWSAADANDTSYQNPSVFGQLVFYEIGQPAVVANIPEPTPAPTQIPVDPNAAYKDATLSIGERVDDLLGRMTLEEKVGQMTLIEKGSIKPGEITNRYIGGLLSGGGGSPENDNSVSGWADMVDGFQEEALATRLGIPLIYGVDAVHGHANLYGSVVFPHNIGLGAANNPELMGEIGRVTAREMIATGIYWNYAPAVSVPRDIRWGRTYEGYSENTELVSVLASAYLQGLQGDDLAAADTVLGTPKHFVGDGGTAWGSSTTGDYMIDQGVTEIDEAELRAVHLPPYAAVIEAGAQNIMISYSSWGGMKMHGQDYLINEVLKGELGFDGFIVSDWEGVDQIDPDYYTAVVTAINAGIDMNMVPYDANRFINTMISAVEAGDIPMARIDEAVRQILTIKFEMGLFERPFSNPEFAPLVGSEEHRAVAREAVAQSQVLLKNEGEMLPLAKDLPVLYVAGSAADDIGVQSGGWTIEWQGAEGEITIGTTILEGIEATVSDETMVVYNQYGQFGDALEADDAAVCLAVIGEEPYAEGFGDDGELRLSVQDLRTANRLAEGCTQLAVVLVSGRPLMIAELIDGWDAFVAAWLPGTEGQGVADVLFGDKPFTGKTAYTWPLSADQLPLDFEAVTADEVLFPFGFGLETP